MPPPDCTVYVGYDRDETLSGYLVRARGKSECVPVTQTAETPPENYHGDDFYVGEFTDQKLRQRWMRCKADPVCRARLEAHVQRRLPPNKEQRITDPHARFLLGEIDEEPNLNLRKVRRPRFFSRAPYHESIARLEPATYTVEFTVSPGPYELRHGMTEPVKLRGWYLKGAGIPLRNGGRRHALILMSGGGGARLTAIQDPADDLFRIDPATGRSELIHYPNATTGAAGQRGWRQFMYELNQSGFDILAYDRRGVGVSSGFVDTNTLQQGRDILTAIQTLKSGAGLRALTPDGKALAGKSAVTAILGGATDEQMPVVLAGNSRGTMSTGWAMQRNFDRTCEFDATPITCGPPVALTNIKGAMMVADFSAGPGYGIVHTAQEDRDRALYIGANEVEEGLVFFPSSAILASVHRWPALFIGRGLWDYAESLEGSLDAYRRVPGLKEIAVVRGPHPFETWPQGERERISQRMAAFATAVVRGDSAIPGARSWHSVRELVATATPAASQPRR